MIPNDPPRLVDDPEAAPALRDAVRAAAGDGPSPEALAALQARLGPVLAPPPAPPFPMLGVGAKLLLVAVVLGGGAATWTATRTPGWKPVPAAEPPRPPAVPDEPASAAPPPAPVPVAPQTPSERPERPRPKPAPDPVDPAPVTPAAPAADTLAAELRALRTAQHELAADAGAALRTTESMAAEFPAGTLAQEREVVAVEALFRLGRTDEARARVEAFAARWPDSPHLRRLRALPGE